MVTVFCASSEFSMPSFVATARMVTVPIFFTNTEPPGATSCTEVVVVVMGSEPSRV